VVRSGFAGLDRSPAAGGIHSRSRLDDRGHLDVGAVRPVLLAVGMQPCPRILMAGQVDHEVSSG